MYSSRKYLSKMEYKNKMMGYTQQYNAVPFAIRHHDELHRTIIQDIKHRAIGIHSRKKRKNLELGMEQQLTRICSGSCNKTRCH